ncbi:MAG: hypothetical protein NTZ35_19230 [Ignavibacteriales bacterium]|nr:hypothetical protein [Ignavibacteriales bacterium]
MNRSLVSLVAVVCMICAASLTAQAQVSSVVLRVNAPVVSQNQPLPISVEFTPSGNVERVFLRYRGFGESEYRQQEMLMAGNSATATLAAQYVMPPYIEYYILVALSSGRSETFPIENAESTPLKATVKPVDPKSLEVRVLSPEQGETVANEDLVIAVSLFYATDNVNKKGTKLFLNGVDVTAQAIFSDDVILYSPATFPRPLSLGVQFLRVELYDNSGGLYHTIESNFSLSTAAAIAAEESRMRFGLNGSAEFRNEDVGVTKNTFVRGQLQAAGTFKSLNFGSNIFITNEEKSDRQPQDRFMAYGDLDVLKVQLGDAFPKFPTNIVSGKRVRGVSANLLLKFFNVDFAYGETMRSIDGFVVDTLKYADTTAAKSRPANTVQQPGYPLRYLTFQSGTFSRSFMAIRPSFGSGENFQFGLTYMNSKDKVESIKYGLTPQENLVAGTDLLIAFDDQRFRIDGQASLSLTNRDISTGNFTDADYALLAGTNDPTLTPSQKADRQKTSDDLKKIADFGGKFITVNENLFPLNPVGKGLPGVAYDGTLSLNYFNNYIRAQYYQRGAAYLSFGNEFLQADIQGLALSDRIRLFQNRVLLSLSYEKRKDNTAETKVATTTYGNMNGSLTIFPAANLPSFTLGYGVLSRSSDASLTDSLQKLYAADDQTSRISLQINYDFTLGARHNLSLGANLSDKKDNLPVNLNRGEQKNNSYFGSLTTFFRIPLQTTISFNTNMTQSSALISSPLAGIPLQDFKLTSFSLNAQYRLLEDKLRLASTVSNSSGDLKRTLVQVGADYSITNNHALAFEYDYINNTGYKNDSIMSLIYRFNF